MSINHSGGGNWIGTVMNVGGSDSSTPNKDKDGACQVNIHGHTDGVATDKLPWAVYGHTLKSAGHNQIGSSPVGPIVGTTVCGFWADAQKQIAIMTHVIAKAGDPVPGQTTNGQIQVDPDTNSNPTGSRSANNAFVTRQGKNIKSDDNGASLPKETSDKDAVDIVKEATDKAKFAKLPTIASVPASKNVLQNLQKVDPQNLSASLPQAVQALIKLKQLLSTSSAAGNLNATGSAVASGINQAASSTSMEFIIIALAAALNSTTISDSTRQVIYQALIQLENQYSYTPDVQDIVTSTGSQFATDLLALITSGTLTPDTLEALIQKYINAMSDATMANSLGGANQSNILSMVSSLIPMLGPLIDKTMKEHLPPSVLDKNKITEALQKYSKNQAMIKMPNTGKKALAIQATSPGTSMLNSNMLNIVNGMNLNLPTAQLSQIQSTMGSLFK